MCLTGKGSRAWRVCWRDDAGITQADSIQGAVVSAALAPYVVEGGCFGGAVRV
jgi:hypothetical protein